MDDACTFHRGRYNCVECTNVGFYKLALNSNVPGVAQECLQENCLGGDKCLDRPKLEAELKKQNGREMMGD